MKTERGVSNMWSVCSRRAESNNLTQMTDSAVSPHLSVENQRTHACDRSTHASKLCFFKEIQLFLPLRTFNN